MSSEVAEITPRIDARAVMTGRTAEAVMPHDHRHVLAVWHKAGTAEVAHAIDAALGAHRAWSRMAWHDRAGIFLRAAELLAGPHRMVLNAATVLGQPKTGHQAGVGAACGPIAFWRFYPALSEEIYLQQPLPSPRRWNHL